MTTAAPVSEAAGQPPAGRAPGVPAPSGWLVLIAGVVGLAASTTLTLEKIRLLADAGYVPSCNLNPILSCGSVMATDHASVLGVPNSLPGIAAFTVVVVTGVLTVAKTPLPRWYWTGLTIGTWAGVGFLHWLIFQSLYRIGALCPYCMVVWAVTIPLAVVFTSVAIDADRGHKTLQVLHRWRWTLTAVWFSALIVLIFIRFQNYWLTLV